MKKVKIRMLVSMAGVADPEHDQPEFCYNSGEVVAVHPALARAWLKFHAEPVDDREPLTNTAAQAVSETYAGPQFLAAYGRSISRRNANARRRRLEDMAKYLAAR